MASVKLQTTSQEQQDLPLLPLNSPFILSYHRTNWETRMGKTAAEDKVVPVPIPRAMTPGTNAIPEGIRDMHGDIIDVLNIAIRKAKGIMLPHDSGPVTPWNPDGEGYIEVDAARSEGGQIGKHYRCKWEDVYPNSPASYTDAAKFDAFVAHWRAEGLIPSVPPRDVVLAKISELRAACSRLSERGAGRPRSERAALMERDYTAWLALDTPELAEHARADVKAGAMLNDKRRRSKAGAQPAAPTADESAFELG